MSRDPRVYKKASFEVGGHVIKGRGGSLIPLKYVEL